MGLSLATVYCLHNDNSDDHFQIRQSASIAGGENVVTFDDLTADAGTVT